LTISTWKRNLIISALALGVVTAVLVFQAAAFRANYDAFKEGVAALDENNKELVKKLVAVETAGMVRNEEGGVVYYHSSARTGKKNRVYLLWELVEPKSQAHADLLRALEKERDAAGGAMLGVAVSLQDATGEPVRRARLRADEGGLLPMG